MQYYIIHRYNCRFCFFKTYENIKIRTNSKVYKITLVTSSIPQLFCIIFLKNWSADFYETRVNFKDVRSREIENGKLKRKECNTT